MNAYYIQVPCIIVSEEDSMVPIVQRRELRLREIKYLPQS